MAKPNILIKGHEIASKEYVDELISNINTTIENMSGTYARKLTCTEEFYNNMTEEEKLQYNIIVITEETIVETPDNEIIDDGNTDEEVTQSEVSND